MTAVPMTGNKLTVSAEVMDRFPNAYHAHGDHGRERRDALRRVARRAGRVRRAQPPEGREGPGRGAFNDEIATVRAVRYATRYGKPVRDDVAFNRDEFVRGDTTAEKLGALKPVFSAKGTVTAGNSSPLSDGAAASLVMSKAKADALGIKPLGVLPRLPGGGRGA